MATKKQQAARIKRVKLLQQVNTEKNCFEKALRSQNMEIVDPPVKPLVDDDALNEVALTDPTLEQVIERKCFIIGTVVNESRK